jgi:hydrogenase maturation protease
MATPTLVLGLGNLLLGDEGLGVRALEDLQSRYDLPADLGCLDGGVAGMGLLAHVEGVRQLLVIDAVQAGREPGSLIRLEGAEIPEGCSLKLSLHQLGLPDLLALSRLRGTLPPRVVLWGMEPACLEPGVGLSAPVASRLRQLVDEIAGELRAWGMAVRPAVSG